MSQETGESIGGFVYEVVKMFLLAVVIIVPIRVFLFQPFIVRGASMEPNFQEKEYLIINEFGYKDVNLFGGKFHVQPRKDFVRGEIVVFKAPIRRKDFYVKRIIGLPGETVRVKDGIVTIINDANTEGFVLDESDYLPVGRVTTGNLEQVLSDGEYFVLGDNRNHSSDSRRFGPIAKEEFIGRVFLRAFPFNKISIY